MMSYKCSKCFSGFDPTAIVSYLTNTGVLTFPGGLPSSLIASGQQWDFPNAWAPTTWVVIQGLRASGQHELARQIAEKWIKRNYSMWLNSGGRMFEKVFFNLRRSAAGCYWSSNFQSFSTMWRHNASTRLEVVVNTRCRRDSGGLMGSSWICF